MEKIIKIISVAFFVLFLGANFAGASEVSGSLNTGVNTGIGGTVISAPTANVPVGTYTSTQNISLEAIGSLSVHYTINGSDPTCSSPKYLTPIIISATSTLKAIACYGNGITSSISSFEYVINLPTYAPPIASPLPGTYTSAQSVTLSTTSVSTSIHYIIDGANPTCSTGTVYSGAISIASTQTIKAIACYEENFSDVATFAYIINNPTSPAPSGGGGGGGGMSPATPKTGDINNDSKVDKYDFAMLMAVWGNTGSSAADLNHDSKVDKYDFALLMLNWNK